MSPEGKEGESGGGLVCRSSGVEEKYGGGGDENDRGEGVRDRR